MRITQNGEQAVLAYADPLVPTPQLAIDAARLAAMRATELVAYWNEHARASDEVPLAEPASVAEVRVEERDTQPAPTTDPLSGTAPALRGGASITGTAPALRGGASIPRKRANARKAPVKVAPPRKHVPAPAPAPARKRTLRAPVAARRLAAPARSELEQRFLALALEIGLSHAQTLLASVRARARQLLD